MRYFLAAITLLILVACGGDEREVDVAATHTRSVEPTEVAAAREAQAATPTATATATATPTPPPTATPSPTPSPTPEPPTPTPSPSPTPTTAAAEATPEAAAMQPTTDPQLAEALVTLADLPTGWTIWDSGTDEDDATEDGGPNFCDAPDEIYTLGDNDIDAEVEAEFVASEAGPFLMESITRYRGETATAVMDVVPTIFGCETWTEVEADGTETIWSFQEMSFPALGDATFARKLTLDDGELSLSGDLVVVRHGSSLVTILHLGLFGVDSSLTEYTVLVTLDRLQAQQQGAI